MKKLFVVLLCFVLAGCATRYQSGYQGYGYMWGVQQPVYNQPVQVVQEPSQGLKGYVEPPEQTEQINEEIQKMNTAIQKQNDQTTALLSGTKFTRTDDIIFALAPRAGVMPDENCLYNLSGMQVMQTTKDGILMRVIPGMGQDEDIIAFLYTDKDFVDGINLYGYASYTGTYKYETVLGVEKNIYAFTLFERNQKVDNSTENIQILKDVGINSNDTDQITSNNTETGDLLNSYTVNVPNAQGGYTAVTIKKVRGGYRGQKGESYIDFPTIKQLQNVYGLH